MLDPGVTLAGPNDHLDLGNFELPREQQWYVVDVAETESQKITSANDGAVSTKVEAMVNAAAIDFLQSL